MVPSQQNDTLGTSNRGMRSYHLSSHPHQQHIPQLSIGLPTNNASGTSNRGIRPSHLPSHPSHRLTSQPTLQLPTTPDPRLLMLPSSAGNRLHASLAHANMHNLSHMPFVNERTGSLQQTQQRNVEFDPHLMMRPEPPVYNPSQMPTYNHSFHSHYMSRPLPIVPPATLTLPSDSVSSFSNMRYIANPQQFPQSVNNLTSGSQSRSESQPHTASTKPCSSRLRSTAFKTASKATRTRDTKEDRPWEKGILTWDSKTGRDVQIRTSANENAGAGPATGDKRKRSLSLSSSPMCPMNLEQKQPRNEAYQARLEREEEQMKMKIARPSQMVSGGGVLVSSSQVPPLPDFKGAVALLPIIKVSPLSDGDDREFEYADEPISPASPFPPCGVLEFENGGSDEKEAAIFEDLVDSSYLGLLSQDWSLVDKATPGLDIDGEADDEFQEGVEVVYFGTFDHTRPETLRIPTEAFAWDVYDLVSTPPSLSLCSPGEEIYKGGFDLCDELDPDLRKVSDPFAGSSWF